MSTLLPNKGSGIFRVLKNSQSYGILSFCSMKKAFVLSVLPLILLSTLFISCVETMREPQKERPLKVATIPEVTPKEPLFSKPGRDYTQISAKIKKILKRNRFNGNALIAHDGNLVLNEAFGMADFRKKKPLKEDSIFQLASVSKQFTAMAIMLLEERGKLKYDDLLVKYIPELPYKKVTVRQLLNHTGGLPNYMYVIERHWKKEGVPDNEQMIAMLVEHKPNLYFRPGTRFDYSNTGYALLASIVERVTKKSFGKFLYDNVFTPLKMENSFVYSRATTKVNKERVNGYHRWRGRYYPTSETLHDGVVGDKGIYSTTEDLFKWDRALYTDKLVSKITIAEAFTRLTLKNKRHWHYGFGFRIKRVKKEKVVFHYGKWNSFQTCITRYIERENTIILLSNTNKRLHWLEKRISSIINRIPQI